jgi:preprotein translocase subunit SecG
MSVLNFIWLILNLMLILLILIRSPNEQSLQEIIGPLKLFDSSGSAEKNIDNLIVFLIITYFFLGFFGFQNLFD